MRQQEPVSHGMGDGQINDQGGFHLIFSSTKKQEDLQQWVFWFVTTSVDM